MRPDETRIAIDNTSIRLRPSIGAALRLVERYRDMQTIAGGVVAGNVSILADVVSDSSDDPNARNTFNQWFNEAPAAKIIAAIAEPMLGHVIALCGADRDAEPISPLSDEPVDWKAHYRELYGIATGFLEWTPETAWDASPWEIHFAYQKRLEIVRALNGVKPEQSDYVPHIERDPDAGAKLRALSAPIGSRVVR